MKYLQPPGDLRLAWASTHPRNRQLKQLAFSRSPYSFQVTEDTPPGTTVGRVSAAHTGGRGPVVFSVLEDDGDGVFLLSPRSGEFFLSRGLDYETERFYGLLVGVRRGDGQLSSARVYFSVVDVNDNPPVPTPEAYSVSVLENSPPGTCILTLDVSDADDGVNAELRWAVIAGDEEAKFAVNVGGVVCLQGALDREKVSVYNLTIRVSDLALPHSSRLTGTALVAVIVQDVNDNGPYFTSPEVLRIREDAPLHAVVMVIHAADADAGHNGEVEYGLEGPSGGTFRIDGARGRLFLEEPLDRESADALAVVVTARDRGSPPRYASVNLTVLVDDVNDNDPAFPWSARSATAREDVPRGTSLLQVRARDPDVGPNGRVRYQLSHSHFAVDPVRGVVVATGRLDREKSPSYSFAVVAVDQGDPPRSATVSVNVTLSDVNDCAPLFTPQSISLHVQENSPDLPRVIHQVSALDEDLGMNSQLTYSITRGNEEGLFSLSPGGTLRVLHSLDRERRTQHMLHIMAVDSGIPPLTGTATALIHVDDLNDNRPVFPQGVISTVVAEDVPVGTVIATVTAFDPDHGANGEVRYALVEGSAPFSIDEVSGAVLTTGALDRESVGSYLLTVTGSDLHPTHPLLSAAVVSVLVRDVNDHQPRFLNSPYVANVPSTVAAVDADMGRNAQLTFSMFGHNSSQLSISPARGEIFTSDVLSGAEDITVGVRVEDGGDDPKDDITTVTVRFQNASEFPVVTVDTRRPLISEDEPLNTLVAVVTGESNRTELISYYLASGHFGEVFQLHPETGELTISSPLDYEANQEFLIWVEARDAGLPPFSSYAEIHINISDVNDNSPVFTQSVYWCETLENSLAGPVCGVSAVDADSGVYGKVQYSILSGNADNTFTIDSDTGILGTVKSLDREKISDYNLTIQAADEENDVNTDTAVVLVVVLDVNDNAPRFSQIFFTEIPEDTPVGFTAIQITSTDEDIGVNAVIVYTVIDQSGSLPFAIDGASGNLVVVRLLDRETQDRYVVKVNANDSAWSISTDVIIEITDVNDNRPVFSQSLYFATITETKTQEVFVMQVHATDSDLGSNKQILYYIDPARKIQAEDEDDGANGLLHYSLESGNEDTIFSIGQNTGLITLIRGLDSERQGAHFLQVSSQDGGWIPKDPNDGTITTQEIFDYELQQNFEVTVKASNPGSRHLFSLAQVHIKIKGVNEFIPTFQKSQYNFSVTERSPNRTRVGKVLATDYDLGPEGEVFYLLIGPSKRAGFDIDERSGEIFTTGDLIQHSHSQAVLRILAKNWGSINGSDIDETIVLVNVTDANDPPEFSAVFYTAEVSEDAALGTSVTRVTAKDKDLIPEWSRFVYSITSGNENSSFALDPVTGIVSVGALLDREQWPLYNLTVVAIDGAFPPATGSASVVVSVTDVNDNPPRLISATGYVRENQPYGTVVSVLKASDADLPSNGGPFTYWLVRPTFGSAFLLSAEGVLSTTRPVDRERNPVHSVLVVVQDAGSPPLSSTATVRVEVLDENDNPSAPRHIYIEVKYYGSTFQGGLIGNVQPEDPDELDLFNCSIRSGPGNMFSFPFGGCDLWSTPYQGETTYNITVEASDQLHPSVNNSIYVSYKGFTNASMDNCVLFYVTSPSFKEFLSFSYLKFVKALDSLFNLQASKTHVFGIKILGDKILLLAAVKSYNGQFLSGDVASDISAAHKRSLEAQSGVEISDITGDPCSVNPCHHGATCTKNIHISQDIAVLESPALMFVSPKKVEIFKCSCLPAFSGTTCESDVDECEGDPCQNGGTCVNHLGGFTCHCARGFSGKHCHSDVDECWNIQCYNGGTCLNMQGAFYCSCTLGYEGEFCQEFVDPCASSPCVQGTCQNHLTGYACDCPFGVGGAHCEEESYGFPELSFLEFPSLDPRNNIISLELATVRQDSLLLYSHGRPGGSEFLALEIVGGRARLSFDLGSGPATVWTTKPVADGSFHSVTARRIGKAASLQVDSCSAEEPHGFCFSRGEGAGRERTLDVHTSNMTFGGIRSLDAILLRPVQVRTHDFIGCVRNAKVNNIPLDTSRALASYNVLERCPRRTASLCDSSTCRSGGVCRDYWSHHTCECGDLFTGTSCETEMSEDHALRLNGQAHIEYVVKESYRRDQQLKDWLYGDGGKAEGPAGGSGLEMNLRTTEQDGALLFILGRKGQATLKVMGGKLLFISSDDISRQVTEIAMDTPLVDSHWHTLHLFRERSATMILLDGHLVMNTTESTLDLTIANVHRMVLGADQSGGTTTQQPGFSGCVGYLRWDNWVLPFSGFSEVVEVRPSPSLTQGGCSSAGACVGHLCSEEDVAFLSCLSQLCPNGDTCALPPWVNGTCACLRNVTDGLCKLCPRGGGGRDVCPRPLAAGAPVWIVGVVVPTTFIVICLTLLVILRCKAGSRRKMQRGGRGSPARLRVKGGVDNGAFCGDAPAPDGQPIRAEKQRPQPAERPLQVCAETDPPSLQTDELEYYEIDSTCGASCSELRAPRGDLEGPRTTTETAVQNGGQRDPQDQARGDQQQSRMQAVLATPHPLVSENEPSDQQQTAVCSRGRKPCASFRRDCGLPTGPHIGPCPFPRRVQVSDLTGPPLGLSAEEVRRLNEPLDQQQGVHVATGRRHAHFAETSDSSDSESHSSFTCSVCGCEREGLSFAGEQACLREHASPTLSGPRQGEPASGDTPSLLREDIPIAEIQRGADSAFLGGPQHWERLLNLGLHFETYAQVFEDIARLPIELQHDLDWQSEAEEII
ncbi:protocadherin Fat 4 [Conger conger]|uniref:protocadherin Fat 4 n=1 Tax=Conger conger TaxID=82655 RepID=UPI002A5A8783|nr:protocadherin Fat 4 [Conger conger]